SARCCYSTATPKIYTLSLHDALPISVRNAGDDVISRSQTVLRQNATHMRGRSVNHSQPRITNRGSQVLHELLIQFDDQQHRVGTDRKSTRLNSSHQIISYAVFCLKKK